MAWYKVGSISVTNGSATVTGSGTQWILNAQVGEALYAPDGRLYEITNIASDTSMTIAPAYLGSTQTGQSYVIVPSQSYIRDLAAQAADLVNNYSTIANTIGVGKFPDGELSDLGFKFADDLDTGFFRSAANEVTFVAGGVAQFKYNTSGLIFVGATALDLQTLKLNGTTVTSTAAELNLLDGATVTTAEINLLDGVTATTAELNILDGVTATASEINILDGVTSTASELNVLDGITATTTELNHTDGVTSNIQTQLNNKAPTVSPTFTGTATFDVINANFIQAENILTTGSFTWDSDTSSPAAISGGQSAPVVTSVHEQMRACVLNDDGTVNYYLDSTNWALKADGTASVLTGADGNVMIEIPKFWYQVVYVTTKPTWKISSVNASGFEVHPAFIKDAVEVDYRYYSAYDGCLKFSRSVTAVADAGGGDITLTTSVQHPLYAGDVVTISGTTSYDDTYTVVSRDSTTTFTVTATFVADETGTADGFVSGKNLDDMTANIASGDEMASVKGFYPLVGVTRAECRTLGAAVGTGWRQLDFALWSAVQMLYLVEFQTFASQAVLGAGNTNGGYVGSSTDQNQSPNTIAGAGDAIANGSTDTTSGAGVNAKPGTSFMKYRGIENFYGNVWNWADGINVNVTANGNVHVTNNVADFADNTSTNMTLITSSLPTASGFIRNLLQVDGYFLSSSNSGASSTTYITDQHFASTASNRVVLVGGVASNGASAGAFCLNSAADSSAANRTVGGRLAF